jgi:methylmalonyl-CoA/ethylmalonyl-CoA epimerase
MNIDEESPFSKLRHIAIVVKDIERAVQFYSSIGIGPFITPPKHVHHTDAYVARTFRGESMGVVDLIVRETKIGPIVLQLVQPVAGECIEKEFLDKKGEGVQHLGFLVDDLDKQEDKVVKLGLKIAQRGRRGNGSGNTFFDTDALCGVVLEIRDGTD